MLIRNLRNSWLKLGRDIWLPPGAVVELTDRMHERNKDFIERAHRNGLIEFVGDDDTGDQVVEVEEATQIVEVNESDEDTTVDEDEEKTIVGEYLGGDMHWKTAEKALKEIDDTDELMALLDEARGAGLNDEHVLIRLINSRLDELTGE